MLALLLAAAVSVPPAEQVAIFTAAGFSKRGTVWKSGNCDGFESNSYDPGAIDTYRDLNGDGRAEAVVTEGGGICYGNTGVHFWLLSKQSNGSWKLLLDELAIPEFLATEARDGWPEILMGAPGLCHRVVRWSGKAYVTSRFQGEDGKTCRPER